MALDRARALPRCLRYLLHEVACRSIVFAHHLFLFLSSGIEGVPFAMNPKFDMSVVMNDVSY